MSAIFKSVLFYSLFMYIYRDNCGICLKLNHLNDKRTFWKWHAYVISTEANNLIIFKYLSFTWPLSERSLQEEAFLEKRNFFQRNVQHRMVGKNWRHVTVGIFWSTKFFWFADIQIFKPDSTSYLQIDKLSPSWERSRRKAFCKSAK